MLSFITNASLDVCAWREGELKMGQKNRRKKTVKKSRYWRQLGRRIESNYNITKLGYLPLTSGNLHTYQRARNVSCDSLVRCMKIKSFGQLGPMP